MSTFVDHDKERWLSNRLRAHGARIFEGVTDREIRKQRARAAILEVGPMVVCARRADGKPVDYQTAFAEIYGEPLTPPHERLEGSRANPPAETSADPAAPASAVRP